MTQTSAQMKSDKREELLSNKAFCFIRISSAPKSASSAGHSCLLVSPYNPRMAGNTFGKLFRVTTAGVSHGPGYLCHHRRLPGRAGTVRRRPAPGPPPPTAGAEQAHHAARRGRRAGNLVGRVRGQDRRHADRLTVPQRGPAQRRLRRHQGQVPARPRRLHVRREVRLPRLPRRRAQQRARDRVPRRGRRGREETARPRRDPRPRLREAGGRRDRRHPRPDRGHAGAGGSDAGALPGAGRGGAHDRSDRRRAEGPRLDRRRRANWSRSACRRGWANRSSTS